MNILINLMNALPVYYILCQACVVSALCIPPLQLKERILKSFSFECLNTVHLKRSQSKFYKMFQNLNFAEHRSCHMFMLSNNIGNYITIYPCARPQFPNPNHSKIGINLNFLFLDKQAQKN